MAAELPHIVVLGAGPAGLGAAYQLRRLQRARVTVLERNDRVGGNAGSFNLDDHRVDFGSHRLHPACDPDILADIEKLLGEDLLDRPRHGRIHLGGRWIHFPLKPIDLFLRLGGSFAAGSLRDMMVRVVRRKTPRDDTFEAVLDANLGPTICDNFYFPYAKKIWGREPGELSGIQARRRVAAGSFAKLLKKVLSQVPGLKPPGAGRFYYPRNGFGQISEAYAGAARDAGAELLLGWHATALSYSNDTATWDVALEQDGVRRSLKADYLWSTVPIPVLARMVTAGVADDVLEATRQIHYRAMCLIYLELDVDRFTEYDAHYFPGREMAITRLSEPKNYGDRQLPEGRTVLCAELPCDVDDRWWSMSDGELGAQVARDLRTAGLPLPSEPRQLVVKRLSHAYPIYLNGYETPFRVLDEWVEGLPRLLSYGRQGLFAHDNTHHALFMAYRAVDCLANGSFDRDRWRGYRKVFETHVVED